jgi:hypothetical protein
VSRVEDSRRRVRERIAEIGRARDREVERAVAVKDALLATLVAAGLLVAGRRLAKAIRRKRRQRPAKDAAGSRTGSPGRPRSS